MTENPSLDVYCAVSKERLSGIKAAYKTYMTCRESLLQLNRPCRAETPSTLKTPAQQDLPPAVWL
jgi:hypothetical protein